MTTLSALLALALATFSLSPLHAAPVCPLAGSSMATLEHVGNDPTSYELTFKWNRADIPIDFVDYHYRINDGEFMNVRAYDGSTPATEATYAISLHPGDVLHAMVTYSSNRVGCEVAISEHRTPAAATASAPAALALASASASTAATAADETSTSTTTSSHAIASTPISCTHINQQLVHDGMGFNIHTELPQDATKVDAHININGADPINVRMIPSSTSGVYELPAPFIANVDSMINYYLTFASDSETRRACDTQTWSTAAEASASASDPTPAAADPAPAPAPRARPPAAAAPAEASVPVAAAARRPRVAMPPAAPLIPSTPAAAETETAARTPAAAATTSSAEQACSLPAITHRVMRIGATGNQYIIEATSAEETPYAYIDVHATVGDTENNARIGINTASAHSEPITVPSGQTLNYYLTYASDEHHACNSPMYATAPME